ncbi:MAG: hypothetical protein L6Q54_11485 [Leptospiraceae bacterium]|nr:hypothetical protein [Leptospiraceae bacterium]MCK6381850.1 hypothetical protein [Leptospiraceae bacterium]
MNLEYNAQEHEYKIDGKVVPSVTQLLPFKKSDFVSEEDIEFARQEGIYIHDCINVWNTTKTVQDETIIEPYLKFLDEAKRMFGKLVLHETQIGSDNPKFAGTPDLVFEDAIVDIKRTFHSRKIHALQCSAYGYLAAKNKVIKKTKNHLILVINKEDCDFRTHFVYDAQAEPMFISLVHSWHSERQLVKYLKSV